MTHLWGVQKDEVDKTWPLVTDLITAALDRGERHTEDEIRKDIESGEGQLWIAWDGEGVKGVCITYVLQHTKSKVCRIWLCTGTEMNLWHHHLATIEAWSKEQGCDTIDAVVRPGWEKIMSNYRKTHVVLEKKL